MKTRMALLALAATATLATSALVPTQASAWGFHGGFHAGFHPGFRAGCCWRPGGFHPGYHFGWRGWGYRAAFWHAHPYPIRWWPRWGYYPRWHWYPRPIVYGAVGGAAIAAAATVPAATPAAAPAPNCLTKQYLPNGAVQFADVCTQEQAVGGPSDAPPPGQPGAQ
jgi:hypothetical protein